MLNANENTAPKFKIELTLEEANIILAGLGELPFKVSGLLVDNIRNQVVPQVQSMQQTQQPME